jgi:hypothetical protein
MLVLVGFGSLIGLKFFRLTDYAFTIVFFILWGNTMVSSSFLVSLHSHSPSLMQHTSKTALFDLKR